MFINLKNVSQLWDGDDIGFSMKLWASKISKTRLLRFDDANSKRTKSNIMLEPIKDVFEIWN